MGKLPSTNSILTTLQGILENIWKIIVIVGRWIGLYLKKLWIWLRLHVPFLEAYIQRHLNNPAAVFIDLAVLVLSLYIVFGITGAVFVYPKKSESRFTESLSILYPYPAAKVNGSMVWGHKFLQRLRFLNTFNSQLEANASVKPPTEDELRSQILEGLIEDKILLYEAKNRGINVTNDEVEAAYDLQKSKTENFEQKIDKLYGMSPSEFKEVIAERLLKEKIKAAVLTRVKVRHILTTDLSAANEAKRALNGGADFAATAKSYSQDSQTKDNGGELGYWTKGELKAQIGEAFENAVYNLEENAISDPVQTQYGYHIIQVTEKSGDNLQSYSDWYASIKGNYKIKRYVKTN